MLALGRFVTAGAAASLALAVTACSGSPAKTASLSDGISSSPASTLVATRWWSNSATTTGTLIDPKNPQELVGKLQSSRHDYCGMLRQTVAAGHSILQGVTAHDPALLTSTKAFVAELGAVAPSRLAGSWKVLGSAVITIVASGGDTAKVKTIDAAAVRTAASTVAADAKHSCGVDLSQPRKATTK
jgi:hypothetical protein